MAARVIVVGGGITGLAAALALRRSPAAPTVTLLEATPRLGGKIRTERVEGTCLDAGPDALLARRPEARAFCERLGLGARLAPVPASRQVQLFFRGRLHALPEGLVLGVPSGLWPLLRIPVLSWAGKARAALDLVLPRGGHPEESLGAFVRRRLGRQVLDRLLDPLLAGVHAGDPERLEVATAWPELARLETEHRSLVLGLRARARAARAGAGAPGGAASPFVALPDGMGELVDAATGALRDAVELRTGAEARAVAPGRERRLAVVLGDGSRLEADAVIVALPAAVAAAVAGPVCPDAVTHLGAIPAASTATVFCAWRAADAPAVPAGSGALVARGEATAAFACSFVHAKFPARVPPGQVVVRFFVGGMRDAGRLDRDDATLRAGAREDGRRLLAITAEPLWTRVYRWPDATPQYVPGHGARVRAIEAAVARVPGLALCGASYRGVGIPDCIKDGEGAAERVLAGLGGG